MTDKVTCDVCGREVGVASSWSRVGFLPGSSVNRVCNACYKDKLRRDDRPRFTKGRATKKVTRKALKARAERTTRTASSEEGGEGEAEEHDPFRPPDELRF